jgi:hypothetical protein
VAVEMESPARVLVPVSHSDHSSGNPSSVPAFQPARCQCQRQEMCDIQSSWHETGRAPAASSGWVSNFVFCGKNALSCQLEECVCK